MFASPTFNSVRHSRWGWAARLRADPMFAVVFMGCLEVVDNAVRRPRDAALTRMRAKVSTCSLTVRKLAALFGVPAQAPRPPRGMLLTGVLQARECGYGYVSALLDVGSNVPD